MWRPSEELPPLQLAEGFLLLTRDAAELLAKLSDSGKRSLDVAAFIATVVGHYSR